MAANIVVPMKDIVSYSSLQNNIILACHPPQLLLAEVNNNSAHNVYDFCMQDLYSLCQGLEQVQDMLLRKEGQPQECKSILIKTYFNHNGGPRPRLLLKTELNRAKTAWETIFILEETPSQIGAYMYRMTNLKSLVRFIKALASQLVHMFNFPCHNLDMALQYYIRYICHNRDLEPSNVCLNMLAENMLTADQRLFLCRIIVGNHEYLKHMSDIYTLSEF
jgi:hypothetical protein